LARFCALAVMMALGPVGRFLGGFSMSIVGQEFGMGLGVTKRFWQKVFGGIFNGEPLLWSWVWLFLYGFRCGFWFRDDDWRGGSDDGHGSNGGLVGLGDQ
jgi:hypothetical protein